MPAAIARRAHRQMAAASPAIAKPYRGEAKTLAVGGQLLHRQRMVVAVHAAMIAPPD